MRSSCTTHPTIPDLGCMDCEDQFCRECAELLTAGNSQIGADLCNRCEKRLFPELWEA